MVAAGKAAVDKAEAGTAEVGKVVAEDHIAVVAAAAKVVVAGRAEVRSLEAVVVEEERRGEDHRRRRVRVEHSDSADHDQDKGNT